MGRRTHTLMDESIQRNVDPMVQKGGELPGTDISRMRIHHYGAMRSIGIGSKCTKPKRSKTPKVDVCKEAIF